jgi:D-tyrosyl-tRNA(Tyr) deacylase
MRVLLQRVTSGKVTVDGQVVGQIDGGLVLLVGIGRGDGPSELEKLAAKVVNLRIFRDDEGKFNRSLLDVDGEVLAVSQFTLYADSRKGRRPSFIDAAPPEMASQLFDAFVDRLRELRVVKVETGVFGAMMDVEIHNDGPVTIWLDSADLA